MELPITSSYSEYVQIVDKLPEDKPSMFGLPENIMQSYQRTRSTQTINQLRALMRSLQGTLTNFYNGFHQNLPGKLGQQSAICLPI